MRCSGVFDQYRVQLSGLKAKPLAVKLSPAMWRTL